MFGNKDLQGFPHRCSGSPEANFNRQPFRILGEKQGCFGQHQRRRSYAVISTPGDADLENFAGGIVRLTASGHPSPPLRLCRRYNDMFCKRKGLSERRRAEQPGHREHIEPA